MKLSLDDPIWTRLYGVYGVEPVAEILRSLTEGWDGDLATDLFWEKLHHQESLYPVTYAALPWLWEIAKTHEAARVEIAGFLSWVIYCAVDHVAERSVYGDAYWAEFTGLALDAEAHAHSWLPEDQRITSKDVEVLGALGDWFRDHCDALAEFAVEVGMAGDPELIGYFLQGKVILSGATHLVRVLEAAGGSSDLFACPNCGAESTTVWDGNIPLFQRYDGPLAGPVPDPPVTMDVTKDRAVARALAERLVQAQPKARAFLLAYSNWTSCRP